MSRRRGFTLLEVLVATVIMGIAVVGLLSAISASMRNAARLTDFDRAALLARSRMNELISAPQMRWNTVLQGAIDPALMGGVESGWQARITAYQLPPQPGAGYLALDRIELQIWWNAGGQRRTFNLDGYRTHVLRPEEVAALAPVPMP